MISKIEDSIDKNKRVKVLKIELVRDISMANKDNYAKNIGSPEF